MAAATTHGRNKQEAGKHEEQRDTDFEARVDGADVSVGELAGGESRVRADDEERGDGPHAGQSRVEGVVFDVAARRLEVAAAAREAPLQRTSGLANTASSVAMNSVAQLRNGVTMTQWSGRCIYG